MNIKKRIKILLICMSFISALFNTNPSMATIAKEYCIDKCIIKAVIDNDGNIHVREALTYSFLGEFNGIFINIPISNANKIVLDKVSITDALGSKIGGILDKKGVYESNEGNSGTYRISYNDKTMNIKIFEPSYNELKTFSYEYTLYNVVSVYTDIAEFYWEMIGDGWTCSISNIEILIDIPEGASKDQLKVWAHGPLEGSSEIVDGNTFRFICPYLPPKTFLETRLVFPTKIVQSSNKLINENKLDKIITEETIWADEANIIRNEARNNIKEESIITNGT
jgi:uncharacterized membrane protein